MEDNRPICHTLVQLITEQFMVKLARTKKQTYIFKKKEFGRCTVFQCNRISRGGLRSDGF